MSHSSSSQHKILHLDGDAFFASVEIAKNPRLRGKPVVVGSDKGIATALSYEAKAKGISRGLPLFQIRRLCPEVVILPTDFHSYALFSKRMINIVRKYVVQVEEYSIDECFADMSGFSYDQCLFIMDKISKEIKDQLDITVSLGLAPNKVLAKVASKWQKPNGKTVIGLNLSESGDKLENFLSQLSVGKIWGIGSATSHLLGKLGVRTALDFANLNESVIDANLSSYHKEIWHELHGKYVLHVDTERADALPKSISRTSTFHSFTKDKDRLLTELSRHVEDACGKARELKLFASRFSFFIKNKDFYVKRVQVVLPLATHIPGDIMQEIRRVFSTHEYFLEAGNVLWRSSGITLFHFSSQTFQTDLFGQVEKSFIKEPVFSAVDKLNGKFGMGTVILASSLGMGRYSHLSEIIAQKKNAWGALPTAWGGFRRLPIPYMGEIS